MLIIVHVFSLSFTQMSVMPEASSALFMSQFSDEAVRDAIARVSILFSSRCNSSGSNVMRILPVKAGYLHKLSICLFGRSCVLRMRLKSSPRTRNLWLAHLSVKALKLPKFTALISCRLRFVILIALSSHAI